MDRFQNDAIGENLAIYRVLKGVQKLWFLKRTKGVKEKSKIFCR